MENSNMTISTASLSIGNDLQDNTESNNLVNVLIKYPEGYEGKRFHQDEAVIQVAKESADILVGKGIAVIVESECPLKPLLPDNGKTDDSPEDNESTGAAHSDQKTNSKQSKTKK